MKREGAALPPACSPHTGSGCAERAVAVGYCARILCQQLRARHGWAGSYATVREAVRPLRIEAATASETQRRFETEPGQQAQADWGQARVWLGGVLARPGANQREGAIRGEVRQA